MTLSTSSTINTRMNPWHEFPAEVYQPSTRPYVGLPDIDYPFHVKIVIVHQLWTDLFEAQKKINFSTVFAGQVVGIKEVHDDI